MTPTHDPDRATGASRLWRRLREFFDEQTELQERLILLNRPWQENYLHWSGSGEDAVLHGHLPPPAHGHRPSMTGRGWCLGLSRHSATG